MKNFKKSKNGLTLVEIIFAIAIIGIIAVGFTNVFSSQMFNIVSGSNITSDAFDNQGEFEDEIYKARSNIKNDSNYSDTNISKETLTVLGKDVEIHKLEYKSTNDKENAVFLSSMLASKEGGNTLTVSGVKIKVRNDDGSTDYNVADLSKIPVLVAEYDDNSSQNGFYVNLFRWWRSDSGANPDDLKFPDDYSAISVPQSTEILDDLLDRVGGSSHVVLSITPVDIHGYRGTTSLSDKVYIKGAEWRIDQFPWVDMNNNYEYKEADDHKLLTERLKSRLDSRLMLDMPDSSPISLKDGSLFVPMRISPNTGNPGDNPVIVKDDERMEWYIDRNINLVKDFTVTNGSDITLLSGLGTYGGSILLHPYIELDSDNNPILEGGNVKLSDTGVSLETDGIIHFETLGKGNILFYNNAELSGKSVNLTARGSVGLTKATITTDEQLVIDTTKDSIIQGDRRIILNETNFNSNFNGAQIQLNSPDDVVFKGGSWSANQTLNIPNGKRIVFEKGNTSVNNLGVLNLGSVTEIKFKNGIEQDLLKQLRILVTRKSNSEMKLNTSNYIRAFSYADSNSNGNEVTFNMLDKWENVGRNQSNFEFSISKIFGEGSIDDFKFAFDGTDTLKIELNTIDETDETSVFVSFRDKYSNEEITGLGIFTYSIDSEGNGVIDVEDQTIETYPLILYGEGGMPTYVKIDLEPGTEISVMNPFTRENFMFDGWNPELPAYMPNQKFESKATWKAISYTITIKCNNGADDQIVSIKSGQKYENVLPELIFLGHSLDGFFDDEGNKIDVSSEFVINQNQNLEARWTKNKYNVIFKAGGGMFDNGEVTFSSEVEYGATITPPNNPSRSDGFAFVGWNPAIPDSMPAGELEFVAQWAEATLLELTNKNNINGTSTTFELTFNKTITGVDVSNLSYYSWVTGTRYSSAYIEDKKVNVETPNFMNDKYTMIVTDGTDVINIIVKRTGPILNKKWVVESSSLQ